jgi:CBS domain-containing protein
MKKDFKTGVKVGDVMTRNFISARPDIPVLSAIKVMVKNRIGSLIITEKGLLRGILTEKDVMWALSKKKDLKGVKAGDVMTRKITTIRPSADVLEALKVMKKAKFRRLPVTVNKRVIGYLTLKELLKIQPGLFAIAHEGQSIREFEEKLKRKEKAEDFKEGVCDECGSLDMLYDEDGRLICDDCRTHKPQEEVEEEEEQSLEDDYVS